MSTPATGVLFAGRTIAARLVQASTGWAGAACTGAVAFLLGACTPALDWRDVRPEGSGLTLLMPCKPSVQERSLPLAGTVVHLSLLACSADGQTWGLAFADMADPARVGAALAELRTSVAGNIEAGAVEGLPLQVPGATPQPASERARFDGRLPDGRPVQVQVAVFARGTHVFQATAMGERLPEEAVDTFFGSLSATP